MHDWSEFGYVIDFSIWLTPLQAAEHFGFISVNTLYNKKNKGELPQEYLLTDGRHWYIHRDAPIAPLHKHKAKQ